jgi:putative endonuclease
MIYRLADSLRDLARRRRWPASQAQGRRGEDLAHRRLRQEGYTVVARNYRLPQGGEIDLIAWDGDACVFVEVKTRGTDDFGEPDAAIDREKRASLARSAAAYVRRAGIEWSRVRFDSVSVVMSRPPRLTLRKDIFRTQSTL